MVLSTGILLILNGHSDKRVKRRGFPRVRILWIGTACRGFPGAHILGRFGVSTSKVLAKWAPKERVGLAGSENRAEIFRFDFAPSKRLRRPAWARTAQPRRDLSDCHWQLMSGEGSCQP